MSFSSESSIGNVVAQAPGEAQQQGEEAEESSVMDPSAILNADLSAVGEVTEIEKEMLKAEANAQRRDSTGSSEGGNRVELFEEDASVAESMPSMQLPYGGDIMAAMRADDRAATRLLMAARDQHAKETLVLASSCCDNLVLQLAIDSAPGPHDDTQH